MSTTTTLAQITELEEGYQKFQEKLRKEEAECCKKYVEGRQPLCSRRAELVNGTVGPTPEELEDFEGSQSGEGGQGDVKGVPFFWATVLSNEDYISEHISQRDRIALEYVEDIRLVSTSGADGVEFHFRPNPFFSNDVLHRVVGWGDMAGSLIPVEEGTDISWKENQNLTVKEVADGEAKEGKEFKSCPSLFRFFMQAVAQKPNEVGTDAGDDEQNVNEYIMQKFERDEAILKAIKEQVIPKAVHLFLSGSLGGANSSGEFDEGYEVVSGALSAPETLSGLAKQSMHVLKAGQKKLDDLHAEYASEVTQLHQTRMEKLSEMSGKRKELLTPSGANDLVVRNFWLIAMRTLSLGPVVIHSRDEKPLGFLSNVHYEWAQTGGDNEGFKEIYTFEFLSNPYFENDVLRKEHKFAGSILDSINAKLVSEDFTNVDWKPGMDLTCKAPSTKSSSGAGKPAATFFGLFKSGGARLTFNIVGEGKEADDEAREMELEFFQQIKEELVVNPAMLFAELDMDDVSISNDDSDTSDLEEQEERKKEIRATRRTVDRPGLPKVQFTKANIFLGILVVVVLAEILMFWNGIPGNIFS